MFLSFINTVVFHKSQIVGFIQRSSDPSQPGRALDKKNSKITQFLYVFIILIITKFGENFEEKIDMYTVWKQQDIDTLCQL